MFIEAERELEKAEEEAVFYHIQVEEVRWKGGRIFTAADVRKKRVTPLEGVRIVEADNDVVFLSDGYIGPPFYAIHLPQLLDGAPYYIGQRIGGRRRIITRGVDGPYGDDFELARDGERLLYAVRDGGRWHIFHDRKAVGQWRGDRIRLLRRMAGAVELFGTRGERLLRAAFPLSEG